MFQYNEISNKGIRSMHNGLVQNSAEDLSDLVIQGQRVQGFILSPGVLARNSTESEYIYRNLVGNQKQVETSKRLRVGIVLEDSEFEFNKIQESKINQLKEFLSDDYELVPFNLRRFLEVSRLDFQIYMSLLSPNQLLTNCNVSSEKLSESVSDLKYLALVPNFLRRLFLWLIKVFYNLRGRPNPRLISFLECLLRLSPQELLEAQRRKDRIVSEFNQEWARLNLDALITP